MDASIRRIRVTMAAMIILATTSFGQPLSPSIDDAERARPDSVVAVVADAYGLPRVPSESVPLLGATFWVVGTNGFILPLPCFSQQYWSCPAWEMADGIYLIDAIGGQVPALPRFFLAQQGVASNAAVSTEATIELLTNAIEALIDRVHDARIKQTASEMSDGGDAYFATAFAYSLDTNALWLEITSVSNNTSLYNLHNPTNLVYSILTTTNLSTPFEPELEVWPSDTNCQPFSLQNNNRDNLFVRAQDWTGVDSDDDGVPDWWAWRYFGAINLSDTNLDYSGNGCTFAEDYSYDIKPTVFKYTGVEVFNRFVSLSQPAVQIGVEGTPYYISTLIDDTNFPAAAWRNYSGSTVTVNLGDAEGWHDVWIGLRGHGDAPADAIWQWIRLKLDATPPMLAVTNPAGSVVDKPVIQLQGYSSEALDRIRYDLSNAVGTVTNQLVLSEGQEYSTNTHEFTTNYFQAFDVPLTNGVNTITIHAADLAGNTTAASYDITLDYSAKTNPPALHLLWPQEGMRICGNGIVCRGYVEDDTATVTVRLLDANGIASTVDSLVGRDGIFYADGLTLAAGTNFLTFSAVDAAGNAASTNITVSTSDLALTIDPVIAGQTHVTGTIGNPDCAIYVNGETATNNGDGTWSAIIAPIGIGGGGVIVNAAPGGGGDSQSAQQIVDPPQGVYVSSYHENRWLRVAGYDGQAWYEIMDWVDGGGGVRTGFHYLHLPRPELPTYIWPGTAWPQALPDGIMTVDSETYPFGPPLLPQEHWDHRATSYDVDLRRMADTELKLATGGPAGSRQMNLWCLSASATEYANPDDSTGVTVPSEQIEIGGFGLQDTNAELWVLLPDNDPAVVTPKVWRKNYLYNVTSSKYQLGITANGETLSDRHVWRDFCVGRQPAIHFGTAPEQCSILGIICRTVRMRRIHVRPRQCMVREGLKAGHRERDGFLSL